jgi:hypothetical protein
MKRATTTTTRTDAALEALAEMRARAMTTEEGAREALIACAKRLARGDERSEETRAVAVETVAVALREVGGWGGCDAAVDAREALVRGLGTCARDACARVAAAAVDAAAAATARRDLGVDGERVVEEIVAPALRHRSSKVRVEALRALTRARAFVDARVVVAHLTGGDERKRNYFGEIACDPSPFVRMELIRLCGKLIGDENSVGAIVAARVTPYVLGAFRDEIRDVREVGEDVVRSMNNFEEIVRENLDNMLIPALKQLDALVEAGWREDIVVRIVELIDVMLRFATDRFTQFIPSVCDGLHKIITGKSFENATKMKTMCVLNTLMECCPNEREYVSAYMQCD